jgi:phosphotransferase system  glucose/maltose/N-acetylglucosamine-specific IIC component
MLAKRLKRQYRESKVWGIEGGSVMWVIIVMAIIALGGGVVGGVLNARNKDSNEGAIILGATILCVLVIGIAALLLT